MKTDCNSKQIEFDGVGSRKLVASFDAEHITSDGGMVLLHRVDQRFGLLRKFADCFTVTDLMKWPAPIATEVASSPLT